jgi:hypothetical protein
MKQYDGQMSLFSEPKVRAEDVHFPKDYVCEGQMSIDDLPPLPDNADTGKEKDAQYQSRR